MSQTDLQPDLLNLRKFISFIHDAKILTCSMSSLAWADCFFFFYLWNGKKENDSMTIEIVFQFPVNESFEEGAHLQSG